MNKTIIIKPSEEILGSCDLIDAEIEKIISLINDVKLGYYEHQVECKLMLFQAIRHFDALITLAREDLILLQSAKVICRAIFECCVHCSWMIFPEDPFEGECRWVSRLKTEQDFHKKLSKDFSKYHPHFRSLSENEKEIGEFREKLEKLLIEKGYEIKKMPNFREMLKSLDSDHLYPHYMFLSQYSHNTRISLEHYVRGYGTEKNFGEFINLSDWKYIFRIGWNSFSHCVGLFLRKTGQVNKEAYDMGIDKITQKIEEIK